MLSGARHVVFRVDAGSHVGFGHLRRCLVLANEFVRHNGICHFVSRSSMGGDLETMVAPHALHRLAKLSADAVQNSEVSDAMAVLEYVDQLPRRPDWVVVDNYELAELWEKLVRGSGHRLAVIDDFRHRRHHADLLISDLDAPFDPTKNSVAGEPSAIVGHRYSLIDPAFAADSVPVKLASDSRTILVSYGASDSTGETIKALAAIKALQADDAWSERIKVHVVVGPTNEQETEVERAAAGINSVIVHRALGSLAPLMRKVDLVLTAGGVTMLEALSLRKVCIVTATGANQATMVADLSGKLCIRTLGRHKAVTADDVRHELIEVFCDRQLFSEPAAFSRSLFDHLGAGRVVATMRCMP